MSLTPGARLGPYEIVSPLGAGGMGEVYRARDPKLGRDVAIKILPDPFLDDPERVARFEREAQVLASLVHPHIAVIHGFEESDGVKALVLELVEGLTLGERLERSPHGLPVDEALQIARQIADALDAAHALGIVHRDLKPANIKLRPDGTVKVLDFGLAKLAQAADAGAERSAHSPTITTPAGTLPGAIIGTAAYMAPEQARGKPVDKRADIWAFGCVLYEMLTGRRPFGAEDLADAVASILAREPDWSALAAETPDVIRRLLRRCLEKDPRKRLHDIADARLEIDDVLDRREPWRDTTASSAGMTGAATPMAGRSRWRRATALVAAVVIAATAGSAATWLATRRSPAASPIVRLAVATGVPLVVNVFDPDLAVSRDGRYLVFVGLSPDRVPQLYARTLDSLETTALAGTANARSPFFSPDGEWIAFSQNNDLKKISVHGGPAVTLCQQCTSAFRGGTWGNDGTIVFAWTGGGLGLKSIPAAGGATATVNAPNRQNGETAYVWPEFLPNGRGLLFSIVTGTPDATQIAVRDLTSGEQTILIRGGSNPHFVPPGHLVYAAGSSLRAVAFDPERLTVAGSPTQVLDRVASKSSGAADFSVSATGLLAYFTGDVRTAEGRLAWLDRQGRETPIGAPSRSYSMSRLSPDGQRAALDVREQNTDIWTWDFPRQTLSRLTSDPAPETVPGWSADGLRVIFSWTQKGVTNLFWQAADGTGAPERLTTGSNAHYFCAATPDGKAIVIAEADPRTGSDLMLLTLADRSVKPLIKTPAQETNADISRDGRWIAYQSNESGRDEIYVRPFPDVDAGRWQVTTAGGLQPLWSHNGRELFFLDQERRLLTVAVLPGAAFAHANPIVVAPPVATPTNFRSYDISSDGQRFLVVASQLGQKTDAAQLHVVLNWQEELKRLAPVK